MSKTDPSHCNHQAQLFTFSMKLAVVTKVCHLSNDDRFQYRYDFVSRFHARVFAPKFFVMHVHVS
jgi:hypothetical protein